jgi:hypothetical protein
MYGFIHFSRIDTQLGSGGPFASPAGWQGDYRQTLQTLFDGDIGVRQQMAVVGRILVRPESGTATRGLPLSPIATFGLWKALGRSVRQGEKALSLWMPITVRRRDEQVSATGVPIGARASPQRS